MNYISEFNCDLDLILDECRECIKSGRVANYIPELAKVDPERLGVYMITREGEL